MTREDFWNLRECEIAEMQIKKVKYGKFVLLPYGPYLRGYCTFFQTKVWQNHLGGIAGEFGKMTDAGNGRA
jgi:hypothetical protein